MTYPVGTPVRTFLSMGDSGAVTSSPVVLVVRESDGEVRLSTYADYRDAQAACVTVEEYGGSVLMAIEGESDAHNGTDSVWVGN